MSLSVCLSPPWGPKSGVFVSATVVTPGNNISEGRAGARGTFPLWPPSLLGWCGAVPDLSGRQLTGFSMAFAICSSIPGGASVATNAPTPAASWVVPSLGAALHGNANGCDTKAS